MQITDEEAREVAGLSRGPHQLTREDTRKIVAALRQWPPDQPIQITAEWLIALLLTLDSLTNRVARHDALLYPPAAAMRGAK